MITVTDAVTKSKVYLNPQQIVAVFEIPEGEHESKTGVNLVNGSIVCEETTLEVAQSIKFDGVE
jgi:hypothetical protein